MFIQDSFASGLERKRADLGLTQLQMADLVGVSLSTYRRLINAESELRGLHVVRRLYRRDRTFAFELIGDDDPLLRLVSKLKGLTPSQLAFIDGIVDFELQLRSDPGERLLTVFCPTGDMEDGMVWDSCSVEKVAVSSNVTAAEGIRVTSNHLHPVYVRGDILLIDHRPIRDGDTGIFINRETGRVYLRKFRQTKPCELRPINDFGSVFYVDPDSPGDMARWYKYGVVVSKVR